MRRRDKEITSEEAIEKILASSTLCHLSLASQGLPYGLTMNYGYCDQKLYFHSAPEGMKFDFVKEGTDACFEIIAHAETVASTDACGFSTRYRSVKGYGRISFLHDNLDKVRGLTVIMKQHTGRANWDIPHSSLDGIVIFTVAIETITGKESRMQPVRENLR